MDNEPFMDAVVQMVLFLELSDPEAVDDDAAIGMLEHIAATLRTLGATEKEQFLAYLTRRASQEASSEERQAIEHLASNLGVVSE